MSDPISELEANEATAPIGAPLGEAANLMDRYRAGADLGREDFGTLQEALADGATAAALGVSDDERQDIEAKAGEAVTLTESDVTTESIEQTEMWTPDPED
jgi:hypothetical protein